MNHAKHLEAARQAERERRAANAKGWRRHAYGRRTVVE